MFTCSAPDCQKLIVYNSGYCNAHYQRLKLYGRLHTVVWGQSNHPLYNLWNAGKNRGLFCQQWDDFKTFLKDAGERPSKEYKLCRKRKKELIGPDNFEWKEYIWKQENESKNDFQNRRRLEKEIANPGLERNRQLKREFDITFEEYNEKLRLQNFVCAICENPETTKHHKSGKVKSLAVDHCHTTGKIRDLLCQRCNRTLGKVNDSVELLDKMKAYVNAHNC